MEKSVFPVGNQMEQAFPLEIFLKKGIPSEVFLFSRLTEITRKSLYHLSLLYHTSAMLLGKNARFRSRKWHPPTRFSVQHAVFSVLTWTPLLVIALRLQVSVNCH